MSKLRNRKLTQSTKGSRKSKKQLPPWGSETEKAWTEDRAAVRNWQKGRTRPNPDPTLKAAMDIKNEQFKQIGRESKEAKWKNVCEELSPETTLIQFWQFYQQTEGNGRTKTTPDLKDTNRARLKTNKEKGQATWAIHTTEQPKQPRGKEAYTELSQQNTCTKWPRRWTYRGGIQRSPLEEAGRIQHLVQIGFDTRISRT